VFRVIVFYPLCDVAENVIHVPSIACLCLPEKSIYGSSARLAVLGSLHCEPSGARRPSQIVGWINMPQNGGHIEGAREHGALLNT
jgi:hypothetical protein